jgi:hypothetical protein
VIAVEPVTPILAIAAWMKFSITAFGAAAALVFAAATMKRPWSQVDGQVVIAPIAKLAFVVGSFVVLANDALALCDVVIGADVREPLQRLLGCTAAYAGALLGFRGALVLDPVTCAVLAKTPMMAPPAPIPDEAPHGEIAVPAPAPPPPVLPMPIPQAGIKAAGLRRVVTKPAQALCWTCGKPKTSPEHLTGCPAGKDGTT